MDILGSRRREVRVSGGNFVSRFITNWSLRSARLHGIRYVGEVTPDKITRLVLRDVNFLVEKKGLVLPQSPLNLAEILTCFRFLHDEASITVSGLNWLKNRQDKRLKVLEDILQFGQMSVSRKATEVNAQLADHYSYYTRAVLIATGGTINMQGATSRQSAAGVVENLTSSSALAALIYPEQVSALKTRPDSSNIGPREWEKITKEVFEVVERKRWVGEVLRKNGYKLAAPGGIIVTHGTDTLEETASILAYELAQTRTNIPVILTGAHSPADQSGSDALINLHRTALLASNPSTPPGAYVVIGDEVHLGTRVKKFYTMPTKGSAWSYFRSVGQSVGKFFDGVTIFDTGYVHWINNVLPHKKIPSGTMTREYGYVMHIYLEEASTPDILEAALAELKAERATNREVALVIQGDFSRNKNMPAIKDILGKYRDEGVLVFVGSLSVYNLLRTFGIVLIPVNMLYTKVRTKIAWLLRYHEKEKVPQLLGVNMAGEEPFLHEMPQELSRENYPSNNTGQEATVIAFPGMTHHYLAKLVDSLVKSEKNHKKIVVYGFGDGHLPIGHNSVHNIFTSFTNGTTAIALKGFKELAEAMQRSTHFSKKATTSLPIIDFAKPDSGNSLLLLVYKILKAKKDMCQLIAGNYSLDLGQVRRGVTSEMAKKLPSDDSGAKQKQIEAVLRLTDEQVAAQIEDSNSMFQGIYLRELAKRVISDVLQASSPLLAELGKAADNGISVQIRTKAFWSKSDLRNYELGNMLLGIGAQGEEGPVYMRRMFSHKAPTT